MSIVVETVSSLASADSTTLTITKPTGLVEGELLVAVLSAYDATSGVLSGTWNTLSTWSNAIGNNFDNELSHSIQYKVATAGDVAASNFTFTHSASERLRGVLLRCSGNNTVDGGLATSGSYSQISANSASFVGTISAYTPPRLGALVIAQIGMSDTSASFKTVSSQSVVNTTMTEVYDAGAGSSGFTGVSAAYGVQSPAAEITQYLATISSSIQNHFGQLAVFNPPVNASGSNTLATTISATLVQSGTCDTIGGTNVLTEGTGVTLAQTGKGTTPTQWTNEAKPSTTWVNETK